MMDHNATMPLVMRMRGLPFFGQLGAEGMRELAKALAAAADLDQANAAVDWLLENSSELPTPADIRLAVANSPRSAMPSRDQKCPHCRGAGLRSVYMVEVEGFPRPPGGKTKCKRVHCGACPPQQCLATPGRDYEWACVDRAKAEQRVIIEASEPCPVCRYGQARGLAYADREAEQQAKMEKRRKGE